MEDGGELGNALLERLIENAIDYLDDGVRAGTIKPSITPGHGQPLLL